MDELQEKAINVEISDILNDTLTRFVKLFEEYSLDRRESTMLLYMFVAEFCKRCWAGKKPSEVLANIIDVTKQVDDKPLVG